MKAWTNSVLTALVGLGLVASAAAQCPAHKAKSDEVAGKPASEAGASCNKDKACCAKGGETASKEACRDKMMATAGMPLMKYKCGDQTTCCPKAAEEMTAGKDVQVRYVVNETEYTDQAEAMKAYKTALEGYLSTMTAVRYAVGDKCLGCPDAAAALAKDNGQTVKYRVAAFTFAGKPAAEKAAEAARTAAESVSLKCVVDGKEYSCDKSAQAACQSKGEGAAKTCEYKVGDMKTGCELTAKVELAKARIAAAFKVVEELAAKEAEGKDVAVSG